MCQAVPNCLIGTCFDIHFSLSFSLEMDMFTFCCVILTLNIIIINTNIICTLHLRDGIIYTVCEYLRVNCSIKQQVTNVKCTLFMYKCKFNWSVNQEKHFKSNTNFIKLLRNIMLKLKLHIILCADYLFTSTFIPYSHLLYLYFFPVFCLYLLQIYSDYTIFP